jgi:hypothetical protein
MFGTARRGLYGLEAGVVLQTGSLVLEPKVTVMSNSDRKLFGASGIQLQINLSYALTFGTPPVKKTAATDPSSDPNPTAPPPAPAGPAGAAEPAATE